MPTTRASTDQTAPAAPSPSTLRRMFAASAQALRENRPLGASTSTPLQTGRSLTKGELTALAAVGLSTEPFAPERSDDPLVKTIVDYMALVETSFSTAEVARMLEVDTSRVRQRLRSRSLLGVEYEGEWRLPRFQFERRKVLPGLATVLAAVPQDANALEVAEWFLLPNPDLELKGREQPMSPRSWLLRGLPPLHVAELARDL